MSRADYSDDLDTLDLGRWRGQVASAIRGQRGQRLLRDMLAAMDAMPERRLIAAELEADGEVCALGAVGRYRHVDMTDLDPGESDDVAAAFDIAEQLAREVVHLNDDCGGGRIVAGEWQPETPEQRWVRMRKWVVEQIRAEQHTTKP